MLAVALLLGVSSYTQVGTPSDNYPLSSDSEPHSNIPAGKTFEFVMPDSKIFPGTRRTVSVYVPAAYRGDKPACVYVGLDGLGFKAPVVFDNLIAQGAIPVTIGVGLSSGSVEAAESAENPRHDRSFEFDSLSDRLPRFLLEEVLPAVQKHTTPDGRPILVSSNPNDRAIGGASTGGIGAFTVAWQRPDEFRRVFTAIGTFVGMRGGEQYNVLVRKTEPKPLRIFMEDGAYDEWDGGPEMGDWWMSNQTMERALSFAGYDVRHVWGNGTHNDTHATSVFPDAMRWLWRDWPKPVDRRPGGSPVLKLILEDDSDWETVAGDCRDPHPCKKADLERVLAFGPDGHARSGVEEEKLLGHDLRVRGLTVRNNGNVYLTAETHDGDGELWLVPTKGKSSRLGKGLKGPSGLAFSPDGLWLMVSQSRSGWAISYRVRADGTVDAPAPFYAVATAGSENEGEAGAIWMDTDGRPYVATDLGVQVFDRNGRVTAILPLPNHARVTGLSFGGGDWHTLYATAGGTVFRRRMKATGAPPWAAVIKLPPWGAG
jgi:gluconolactonase